MYITYSIQITAGSGGQIQVFINSVDKGYFRGTKIFVVNPGDNISVWCDADSGYTFTNLCTPDGTCTTARPFSFSANMNISMTATFTPVTCTLQDYSLSLDKTAIQVGTSITAKAKFSGYAGYTWKVIWTNSPNGEVSLGSGTLDSNSCGSITLPFSVPGNYILKGRVCVVWYPDDHCAVSDTNTNNSVTLSVTTTLPPPGGTTSCDPSSCNPNTNFCILGTCVPKNVTMMAAIGLFAYMILRGN